MRESRRQVLLEKLGGLSLLRGAQKAVGDTAAKAVGSVAGAPIRYLGRQAKNTLVGRSVKGRPWYQAKRTGSKEVTKSEAKKIISKTPDGAWKTTAPDGSTRWMKNTYAPGGVVGYAMKHPAIAAGVGVAGLAVHGQAKQVAELKRRQQQQQMPQDNIGGPVDWS